MIQNSTNNTNIIKYHRNSSIELLRIISMIMIVFHHFAVHGGFNFNTSNSLSISHLWYNFIVMGGKIGVDIFVLISGYFLINSKDTFPKLNKILKFIMQILFYSVTIYIISCILGINRIEIKALIKIIFPITFSEWWFASTYFVMFLLHPLINKLLNNLNKNDYQKGLLLLIICWSIIPTFTTSLYQSNSLLWFITLYSIAGYIRLYGLNPKLKHKQYIALSIIFIIITYLSSIIFIILGKKYIIFINYQNYFYGQEKITVLLISVCLFMTFSTLKIKYNKWINIIASATFGVYLIHDNNIIRPILWMDIFKNAQYQNSLIIIPYSILAVFLVYTICTIIDLLRKNFLEKTLMKIVNKYSDKWTELLKEIIYLIKGYIFGNQ